MFAESRLAWRGAAIFFFAPADFPVFLGLAFGDETGAGFFASAEGTCKPA